MPTQHNHLFVRLCLDIAVRLDPIQGRLVDERGTAWPFIGWLDLVQVLEQHRNSEGTRDNEDDS